MTSRFARFEPPVHAILRIVVGALMFCHGFSKLFGVFGQTVPIASQLGVGGILELVGGALIAVGLFTRIAAFILSGEMAVAYFQFHWKLDMSHWRFLPIVNKGEDTVLYCFVFLWLAAAGAGPWSLDRKLRRA
jgi:putative oxidoreductase